MIKDYIKIAFIWLSFNVINERALRNRYLFNQAYTFKMAILPHRCRKSHKLLWLRRHCKITVSYFISDLIYPPIPYGDKLIYFTKTRWLSNEIAVDEILSGKISSTLNSTELL